MKKILITILIVLLLVLAYSTIAKGFKFEKFSILSVQQIKEKNDSLTEKISAVKSLLEKEFPTKKEDLSQQVSNLLEKKEGYFNLVKTSTEGQIVAASTTDVYYIEFLWTKIGTYAREKGVNFKMSFSSADAGDEMNDIAFEVQGYYVAIVEFLYALGNDSELNFKIEEFKILPSGDSLTATFNVRNIRIENEETTTEEEPQEMVEEDIMQEEIIEEQFIEEPVDDMEAIPE